jgi:hypothetical protein
MPTPARSGRSQSVITSGQTTPAHGAGGAGFGVLPSSPTSAALAQQQAASSAATDAARTKKELAREAKLNAIARQTAYGLPKKYNAVSKPGDIAFPFEFEESASSSAGGGAGGSALSTPAMAMFSPPHAGYAPGPQSPRGQQQQHHGAALVAGPATPFGSLGSPGGKERNSVVAATPARSANTTHAIQSNNTISPHLHPTPSHPSGASSAFGSHGNLASLEPLPPAMLSPVLSAAEASGVVSPASGADAGADAGAATTSAHVSGTNSPHTASPNPPRALSLFSSPKEANLLLATQTARNESAATGGATASRSIMTSTDASVSPFAVHLTVPLDASSSSPPATAAAASHGGSPLQPLSPPVAGLLSASAQAATVVGSASAAHPSPRMALPNLSVRGSGSSNSVLPGGLAPLSAVDQLGGVSFHADPAVAAAAAAHVAAASSQPAATGSAGGSQQPSQRRPSVHPASASPSGVNGLEEPKQPSSSIGASPKQPERSLLSAHPSAASSAAAPVGVSLDSNHLPLHPPQPQPNGHALLHSPSPDDKLGLFATDGGCAGQYEDGTPNGEIYFMGIIDILQVWNAQKKAEKIAKVYLQRRAALDISAAEPAVYAERFKRFVADACMPRMACPDCGALVPNGEINLPLHRNTPQCKKAAQEKSKKEAAAAAAAAGTATK